MKTIAALTGLALLAGCGYNGFAVRSDPPGALVYIDGKREGVTPYLKTFPGWYIPDETKVRVELEGYRPKDEVVHRTFVLGRVVRALFIFGIPNFIAHGVSGCDPEDFELVLNRALPGDPMTFSEMRQADEMQKQAAADKAVEEKIEQLNRLRDKGAISAEEYNEARRGVLNRL